MIVRLLLRCAILVVIAAMQALSLPPRLRLRSGTVVGIDASTAALLQQVDATVAGF